MSKQKTPENTYWNEKQFKVMRATNLFMLKIGSCEGICETCKETCEEYEEWSELCKEE